MWLKSVSKEKLAYIIIGVYAAVVLWITLICRKFTYSHAILIPFSSYVKTFQGDGIALLENIENILMFIPLGYILQMFLNTEYKRILKIGFLFSLGIEFIQLVTTLGCFEIEDLMHNSIGALFGYFVHLKVPYKIAFDRKLFCNVTVMIALAIVISLKIINSTSEVMIYASHFNEMRKYAELNDSSTSSNYLVFTEEFGQIGDSDVTVSLNEDGSYVLRGTADEDAWRVIAVINLDKGSYIFKDLNNSTNVQMILEKRNLFSGKYSTICRLGHAFTIKHHTQIIVAIGVETGIKEG